MECHNGDHAKQIINEAVSNEDGFIVMSDGDEEMANCFYGNFATLGNFFEQIAIITEATPVDTECKSCLLKRQAVLEAVKVYRAIIERGDRVPC